MWIKDILFYRYPHTIIHSSCINPMRLRGVGALGCNSASASLMASSWARVDSLMSFWSASDFVDYNGKLTSSGDGDGYSLVKSY